MISTERSLRLLGESDLFKNRGRESQESSIPVPASMDPYFWWHASTQFRALQPSGGGVLPDSASMIAEGFALKFKEWCDQKKIEVSIADHYLSLSGTDDFVNKAERFFTFDVALPKKRESLFARREGEVDLERLKEIFNLLANCKYILRLQFGFSRGEQVPRSRKNQTEFLDNSNQHGPALAVHPSPVDWPIGVFPDEAMQVRNVHVVIGIIDDGAAFAHHSVRSAAPAPLGTRVEVVWNQTRQISKLRRDRWRQAKETSWDGAMLEKCDLDCMLQAHERRGEVDELTCYAELFGRRGGHLPIHRRFSHGAAVMATAAGDVNAANIIPPNVDSTVSIGPKLHGDHASKAPIIFVELPVEQIDFSSGRWMPISALDGINFIASEARRRFRSPDGEQPVPVVVNISSGANAGRHDGTSMIERAIDQLLESDPRLAVVFAAGNSRLAATHWTGAALRAGHAEAYLRVPPDKTTETFVEIWPQLENPGAVLRNVRVVVTAPDGLTLEVSSTMDGKVDRCTMSDGARDEQMIAGLIFAANAVQSCDRPMFLLALAATRPHEFRPWAHHGVWTIRVVNDGAVDVKLDAWIERDEVVFGRTKPQRARFVDDAMSDANPTDFQDETGSGISRDMTVSNMSTTRHGFTVAAGTGGSRDGFVSQYSGAGGGDSKYDGRPGFIARADRSLSQPGMPAWGAYGSARSHMNGTSIAAPQVTRLIANAFAVGQDRQCLQTLSSYAEPRKHPLLKGKVSSAEGRLFVENSNDVPPYCRP